MVKYFLMALSLSLLVGCASQTPSVIYKDKDVPVYVVPDSVKIERPTLAIETLTDAQKKDQGELTQAYAISLKQVMQYACKLENVVNKYHELAAKSPLPVLPASIVTAPTIFSNTLNMDVSKDCTAP
jgi:hypothetical protein